MRVITAKGVNMAILEELGITREELIQRTIDKILEIPSGFESSGVEDYVEVSIHDEVKQAINNQVKAIVEKSSLAIQKAIDDAIRENVEAVFSKPFTPVDRWGDKKGTPTTIRDMIADESMTYWTKKVNERGEVDNGYGTQMLRVEYYAKKFMLEFYSKELSGYAENMAKEVKAKIPQTFASEVAASFMKYFK